MVYNFDGFKCLIQLHVNNKNLMSISHLRSISKQNMDIKVKNKGRKCTCTATQLALTVCSPNGPKPTKHVHYLGYTMLTNNYGLNVDILFRCR